MKKIFIILALGLLIISCNTNQKEMQTETNPFYTEYGTPFEVPPFDIIKNEHFLPAFKEGMKQQSEVVETIADNPEPPTFENTLVALDQSGRLLTNVSSVFFNLSSANTNDSIQAISKEVAPLLSAHRDNISLNEKLFERIKSLYEQKDKLNLTTEQLTYLEKTYKDFVRGGANLPDDQKEKFRRINEELSVLTVEFDDNLLAETNSFQLIIDNEDDLAGLPEFVRVMGSEDAKAAGMEDKWLYTLNKPSLIPFLQYADNRELREKIFKGYINRGNNDNNFDNKKIAARMASLRVERANLLGYKSHADFVLDVNMAKTPDRVYALMDQVWNAALPMAKAEVVELQKMIHAEGNNFKLEAWDWWYYAEKLRKEKYALDDELLKPYFEL